MEKHPLVSIVITCSNQAAFIEEAISSALWQNYPNKEVIVVDDGSRDSSREKIRQFNLSKTIFNPTPHSSAFARNSGLRQAKGEYAICLDGDDFLELNYLDNAVPIMGISQQINLVYSARYELEGKKRSPRGFRPFCRDILLAGNFIPSATLFRKKSAFDAGLQNETLRILEDYDFWLKMTRHAYAYYIPKTLYTYRIHQNNKSKQDSHAYRVQHTNNLRKQYRKHEPVLIRLRDHPEVYEIISGRRCLIPSRKYFEAKNYAWHKVVPVDPALFSLYPLGHPLL